MQRFRKILVGVDLSSGDRLAVEDLGATTREAINRAIWLAGESSAELTFFAALDLSAHTLDLLEEEQEQIHHTVRDDATAVLAELVHEAKEAGVAASSRLEFGRSWLEIIKEVLRHGHDLVIVGTRDLSATGRFLMGSTATKLLRKCPCPVWITKPDPDLEEARILVADDLTDVGNTALQIAIDGAQLLSAKVHVVHAVQDGFEQPLTRSGLASEKVDAYREKQRAAVENELQQRLSMTDYRTLSSGVQVHVENGPADIVLLQAIEEYGIDLLVMGTIGRSGIPGMLIGNTAERLLPQVTCSVLAIKPADFVSPITLD
jgi:universal stress protein E